MRFDKFLEEMLRAARGEAREDGSSLTEAHHFLLALAGSGEPSVTLVLATFGLDHGAIRAALDREIEVSLAAAGVTLDPASRPSPRRRPEASALLGASVRLALERGLEAGRKDHKLPGHLLLGVVLAPVGTVPRALGVAGVDRDELIAAIRGQLANDSYERTARADRPN